MDIKFSIVMPCFNVAEYVDESVGDVLAQTYDRFELILVEDASADGTKQLLERFAKEDERVKLIEHDENMGLSMSRNSGLEAASGDYILFWDSDDRYDCKTLERISVAVAEANPQLVVYSLAEDYYDRDGAIAYSVEKKVESGLYENSSDIHKKVVELEEKTLLGYAWNKAYRLDYLKEIGLKFSQVDHIEDIVFNLAYIEDITSMVTISEVLYHYRNSNQPRLTDKYLEDYLKLQVKRVNLFIEQQTRWNSIDDSVYCLMSSIYFRSLVSATERQIAAGVDTAKCKERLKEEFNSDTYNLLRPYFDGSWKLRLAYGPFLDKNVTKSYSYARAISKVRRNMPFVFSKLKQNR